MTDEQIIKALELFKSGKDENFAFVSGNALDLINRQKAEKEALIAGQETLQEHIAKQNAEIESKNDLIHRQSDVISEQKEKLESIYSEAVKEFAERLKEIITMSPKSSILIDKWYIDNLVKEMVGEG